MKNKYLTEPKSKLKTTDLLIVIGIVLFVLAVVCV